PGREVELRARRGGAVAAAGRLRAGLASARDPADLPRGRDLADLVVAGVADVDVARFVDGHPERRAQLSRGRGAGVAAIGGAGARGAVAGEPGDPPAGRQLPDLVVEGVGDVDVPGLVDRDAVGEAEGRSGRRPAVAAR